MTNFPLLSLLWALPVVGAAIIFVLPASLRQTAKYAGLAVSLAVPTVAAVLVFQLAAAIALRTASCDPGPGFLHAATALVVLVMILVNAGAWSRAAGPRLLPSLAASLSPPAHAPSLAVPPSGSGGRQ